MKTHLLKKLPQLVCCFTIFNNFLACFHSKLEDYIDRGEDTDNVKVKKKMLIYYVYTTIVYSLCLPLFNPFASMTQAFIATASALGQLLMIKVKSYYVLVSYFVVYTFLSIYLPVQRDDELLKAIGTALMHHNLFFLFPDSLLLKIIYIFGSQYLIRGTEVRVLALVGEGEVGVLQAMIKNFFFCWPLIYIVNHINSMCLVRAFQNMMKKNKEVENKFRNANQKLSEINAKLNETMALLEKTNQELKDAVKARELFIASASHELRNPLNSMIGNIELVRLDTKDPRQQQMLERCKVCGEVLLALINNILDVAKINAEKLELHYQPVNFLEVFEKIWNISAFKMKGKGIKGELYVSHDFPKYVEMDSHRLMQILLNLIGNSAKFTTKGFVKVIVTWHRNETYENLKQPHQDYLKLVQSTHQCINKKTLKELQDAIEEKDPSNLEKLAIEGERDVDLEQESNYRTFYPKFLSQILASTCCHLSTDDLKIRRSKSFHEANHQKKRGVIKIEIVDSGCGISQSSLQNLFHPFCQANASISHRFGGTGLGLYITQQLIQKMGGEIQVYSRENVGSDFCVLLPAITTTDEEAREKLAECDSSQELPRIPECLKRALIVDDDPFNRSVLAGYLKRLNVECDLAINGKEAVDLFTSNKSGYYSFIIMDLDMAVMNGYEASRRIRKYEADMKLSKIIPIVIVTGNCTESERVKCLDPSGGIQATDFYRKPFTFKDCQSCVQTVIHKHVLHTPKNPKLLIVDDDPFNVTFLREFMEKYNFTCEVCYNGKQAVEKVLEGDFNAVLIDCEMPEMDGYMATKLIKQRYPQLLVIGITGDASDACKIKAKGHGMNMLETKPVNLNGLVDRLMKQSFF